MKHYTSNILNVILPNIVLLISIKQFNTISVKILDPLNFRRINTTSCSSLRGVSNRHHPYPSWRRGRWWKESYRVVTTLFKRLPLPSTLNSCIHKSRPHFHLNIFLGPYLVLSTVFVLTIQLIMNSLNVYHQFMYFRDSLPKVGLTRSPQPEFLIKFLLVNLELPCCTSINFE